jgi:hypothetical protein
MTAIQTRSWPGSKRVRRLLAIGLLALAVLGTGACGGDDAGGRPAAPRAGQKIAPSLKALFQQTLQRSDLSEFERQAITRALETGKLSQADYEEAHSRYARCMKDAGQVETYTKLPNGLYEPHPDLTGRTNEETGAAVERYKTVSDQCLDGVFTVQTLYSTQQANPDLLADNFESAVRCLVKTGVAPADYTADDLKADQKNLWADAPYKVNDPQAHACLWSAGFAVQLGG